METSPRGFPSPASPSSLPAAIHHQVLNTVCRTLLPPPLPQCSLSARRLQAKQGESREWAAGRGAHHLSTTHSGGSLFAAVLWQAGQAVQPEFAGNGEHGPARVPLTWLPHPRDGETKSRGESLYLYLVRELSFGKSQR